VGLFDSLAGAVLSKVGGDKGAMAQVALDLFNQLGGLEGVISKFNASGLSKEVASWVGNGENLPISPADIIKVLGQQAISDGASKLNMSNHEISSKIAEYLPQLINKMTPDGKVSANSSSVMAAMLDLLK
jgi:uncharacterized protein YidB (DUF937 family)